MLRWTKDFNRPASEERVYLSGAPQPKSGGEGSQVPQKDILSLIALKESSAGPVYAQVRDQLQEYIRNKEIPSGESLPAPAQLAQRLAVDRGEIQRAYFELEQYGLIKKTTGKGFLDSVAVKYVVN